jgi:cytochrome oxidase Cu insertion factor (SCO1/SenC/PrrC family)
VSETHAVGRPRGLPRPRLLWAAAALAGLAIGVAIALLHRPAQPAAAPVRTDVADLTWPAGTRPAPAFRLDDGFGRPVTLAALRGRPVLVTFIDPLCRNFCPLEAQQLGRVVRDLPPSARPAVVAVSVNVYGDARSNLLLDNRKWGLPSAWRWAVGSDVALARVWRRYEIGVRVSTQKIGGVTVHEVAHTEAAYLVDRDGYERALFMWPFTAAAVERSLERPAG